MASRHVSGPRRITLHDGEVALVCMLKNGSYYLDALLDHHRSIGVRNFLFIDNGSDDDTISRLSAHRDVTVISNKLPVAIYESSLRAQIARRVIRGGWFLFVDSDELVEMPNGEGRRISDYTGYCNDNGYDVVVGQVLDMFSAHPLSETVSWSYEESIKDFDRFSLRDIVEFDYHDEENVAFSWFLKSNTVSNRDIRIKFGGIRREVFGEYCALTVHRLVKNDLRIGLYTHPHCSSNVRCADFTMLVRHFKFAGPYLARERQQLVDRTWQHGENQQRLAVIKDHAFTITGKEERRYAGTSQLVIDGFLACSERFQSRFPPMTSLE